MSDCCWHLSKASPCDSHSRFPDLSHFQNHVLCWLGGPARIANERSLRTGFKFRSSNARFLHCSFAAILLRALERAIQMRLRLSPLPPARSPNCCRGWSTLAARLSIFSRTFMPQRSATMLPKMMSCQMIGASQDGMLGADSLFRAHAGSACSNASLELRAKRRKKCNVW